MKTKSIDVSVDTDKETEIQPSPNVQTKEVSAEQKSASVPLTRLALNALHGQYFEATHEFFQYEQTQDQNEPKLPKK